MLTTALGFERQFHGRYWDASTIREAIASTPQSEVSMILKLAFYRHWELEGQRRASGHRDFEILGEFHDASLGQIKAPLLPGRDEFDLRPDPRGAALLRRVVELQTIPVQVTDIRGVTRTMTIAASPDIGRNWAEASDPARWKAKVLNARSAVAH